MTKLTELQTTILNQLTDGINGQNVLIAMTGAYNFMHSGKHGTEPDNISFRFKGSNKANWASIRLNGLDLYDVEFCMMKGTETQTVAKYENAFAEDLRDIFEDVTGLYLKL